MKFYEYDVYNAVRGQFVPKTLLMKLNGTAEEFSPRIGRMSDQNEAVLVHEHFHYFQIAMTSFGQATWVYWRDDVVNIIKLWKKLTNETGTYALPWGYLVEEHPELNGEIRVFNTLSREFKLPLDVNNFANGFRTFSELSSIIMRGDIVINPTLVFRGESYSLNGIDIIESHCKHIEGVYSYIINGKPFEDTYDLNKLYPKYYLPFYWFLNEVGEDKINLFPVICDLSFQFIPKQSFRCKEEWESVHPPWRFVKMVNAIKNISLPEYSTFDSIIKNYNEICRIILNSCKFNLLDEVLEFARKRYKKGSQLEYERRMTSALEYRMRNPWVGANPFWNINNWVEMKNSFGPSITQLNDKIDFCYYIGEETNVDSTLNESVMELHIQALACQISSIRSQYFLDINEIQCGFGYFGLWNGCAYQRNGSCNGSILPEEGFKIEFEEVKEGIEGCTFAVLMHINDIDLAKLKVNHLKKFDDLLTKTEEGQGD